MALRVAIAALAALLAASCGASAASCKRITATDGDTAEVAISGGPFTGIRMRLLGIDTPETNSACNAERVKAYEARAKLIQLTTPCATPTTELDFDQYGRLLGYLRTRDGQDIGRLMVDAGLARAHTGSGARKPWCNALGDLLPP